MEMKRDIDVVREILISAESLPISGGHVLVHDVNDDIINYHIFMMHEADLILLRTHVNMFNAQGSVDRAVVYKTVTEATGIHPIQGLTWKGHEFLDTARSPKAYEEA